MPPTVSVVMPVYNVARTVAHAVASVLSQSFTEFELIIVDDGGTDDSVAICRGFADPRIRIISQANRGLAGARNTGISAAIGEFVALLDSDDAMKPEKLERHVAHLRARPAVGISYAGADLMDDDGQPLGIRQEPKRRGVTARDVFCGRVILNGSIPVFRREALEQIAFRAPDGAGRWYFDERFRRSEDVECWMRLALQTSWQFAGLPGRYTDYRINRTSLSADVILQLDSWERVYETVRAYAPGFIARHGDEARARELRYLARRSFHMRDRGMALHLITRALALRPSLLLGEPVKTGSTLAACAALRLLPERSLAALLRTVNPALAGAPSA
ncbi:MAG: glycosyltransferase family 2 protein [Janthinobacterium lividum]